ncbi:MAG TPA: DUF4199 domain-containing protein [Bacteroidia bacterium]|nr:DUF4199 domain-containing protein [Bacteroidia bacterium]
MNKKVLYLALVYSALVIAFKLFILLGGHSLSHFGYFYSNLSAVLFIYPFYIILIKWLRDKDYNGVMSGREAFRHCLALFAVSVVLISIYNYVEFKRYGPGLAEQYYRGNDFLQFLKSQKNVKPGDYQRIIEEQIKNGSESAFKATTGKLFSYLVLGISGAFVISAAMKRNAIKTN